MIQVNASKLSQVPVCVTCGTQYPEAERMDACPVCSDARQYVGWDGQRWTTSAEVAAQHEVHFEDCAGVMTLQLAPRFGIGQLISIAKGTFDSAGMFAAIILVMVITLFAEWIMTLIENRLAKWRPVPQHDMH